MYPYQILNPATDSAIIQRCTHAFTWNRPHLIDVNWGISLADEINSMMHLNINPLEVKKMLNSEWISNNKPTIAKKS